MKTVSRIVKLVLGAGVVGMELLALSNVVRARWVYLGVDVILAVTLAGLYYAVARWPQLARTVGGVMAGMLIVVPLLLVGGPGSEIEGGTIAVLGTGAVLILSLLWPVSGVLGAGVETGILSLLSFSGKLPWSVVVIFAVISAVIYVFSRSLFEALEQAEAGQVEVTRKNQELERALQELTATLEQERNLVATIRELETPLIESERGGGILVVVGYCDTDRMQAIQDTLTSRLKQRSLRRLVVDISGARFDEAGLTAFIQTLQVLRLIVSDVVVSGVDPQRARELAQDKERVRLLRQTVTFVHSLQEAFVG